MHALSENALVRFSVVAVPVGWLLLTPPVVLGLPVEPFVLAVLLAGLVVPAIALTRSEGRGGVRGLLRDTVRPPRAVWTVALIPGLTWAGAALFGVDRPPDRWSLAVTVGSSVLIVNLWEELAWTGFVQRRAVARWGDIPGSLVTAGLFVGVHLPLALDGGNTAANLGALVVSGVGLRLLITAVDRWSGGSLLTVALLHASFNVAADLVAPSHDWIRYAVTLALGIAVVPALRSTVREEVPT